MANIHNNIMKTKTIEYINGFKNIHITLTKINMYNFLQSYIKNEVKKLDRYNVMYIDLEKNKIGYCNLKLFGNIWKKEIIPITVEYNNSIDFVLWTQYKNNKDINCRSCTYYRYYGNASMLHICIKNIETPIILNYPTIEYNNMLTRYKKCPIILDNKK